MKSHTHSTALVYGSIPNYDNFESDAEWYRYAVASVVSHYEHHSGPDYLGDDSHQVAKFIQLIKYYFGEQDNISYKFMEEADEGISAPAEWIPGKKIGTLIDHMKGNFVKMLKSYDLAAYSLSEDASNEKQQMLEDFLIEAEMKNELEKIEQDIGQSIGLGQSPEGRPDNEDEAKEYVKNYKRYSEKLIYTLANQTMLLNNYQEVLSRLFVHMLIMGVCGLKVSVYNGKVVWEPINPINLFFDKVDNDLQRGMKYAGRQYWLSIGEAFERFDLNADEKDRLWSRARNRSYANSDAFVFGGVNWNWYKDNDEFYIRVAEAEWLYPTPERHLKTVDKYGNEHYQPTNKTFLTETQKAKGHELVTRDIEYAYQATLVGLDILKDEGIRPNQPRQSSNVAETELSYHVFTPNIQMGRYISPAEKLIQHQDRADLYHFKIQEHVAHDYGRVLKIDTSQLDPETAGDPNELAVWIKTNSLLPYNSAENEAQFAGRAQGAHYFEPIDLGLSESVQSYITLIQAEHQQMEEIASIPKQALGQQHAYQPQNVQQKAITQSSITNYNYYKMFGEYTNKILQYSANVAKILYVMDKSTIPIANTSDMQVDFLDKLNKEELMWEDLMVYVDVDDIPTDEDKQEMVAQAQAALQNQMIDYLDYLEIKQAKTYSEAHKLVKESVERKQKEKQKGEMRKEQREFKKEIAKIKEEVKAELEKSLAERQTQGKIDAQLKNLDNRNELQQTAVQNKEQLSQELFRHIMNMDEKEQEELLNQMKNS